MKNINYCNVIENSQYYTDIEQLIISLKYLIPRVENVKEIIKPNHIYIKNLKQELEYIIISLENTKNKNIKL